MYVPQQSSEWNLVVQIDNRIIGFSGSRLIGKLKHQAAAEQKKHQHHGDTTQSPGQGQFKRAFRNGPWSEMQQKAPEVFPPAMLMMICLLLVRKNRQAETLQDIQDYSSTMISVNYP